MTFLCNCLYNNFEKKLDRLITRIINNKPAAYLHIIYVLLSYSKYSVNSTVIKFNMQRERELSSTYLSQYYNRYFEIIVK